METFDDRLTPKQRLDALTTRQDGVLARWQTASLEIPPGVFRAFVRGWRQPHAAVYLSGHGQVTDHQRLLIACLTTPTTYVDSFSAAWHFGFRRSDDLPVTAVRPGSGGLLHVVSAPINGVQHERLDLAVRRSARLDPADLTVVDEVRLTTPARTLLDLLGRLKSPNQHDWLVREALRIKAVTAIDLDRVVKRNRKRPGVARLRALAQRYAGLPVSDARSGAEALALAVLAEAGVPLPHLNRLVAGYEADLVWVAERFLIELDSNEYHPFPVVDELKQRAWESAGWEVVRLPVNVAEDTPQLLIAAARRGIDPAHVAARLAGRHAR